MKYNHITMLPERAFLAVGGRIKPQGGSSGSGSASTPTSTTVTNTNIPSYAQPYVQSTLGQAQALTDVNQNPYQQYQGQQVAGFTPMQAQAFQGIAGQQVAPQIQQATDLANQVGQNGLAAYGTAGQLQGSAMDYGNQASGLAPQDIAMGNAGAQAGMSYGQNATNPNAVQQYMNPYIQNTLQPALQILNQQYDMANSGQQGAATSAGAFGGSREALMEGLNNQNRSLAQNQLVGNAYNQAYNTANTNMQQASQLGMQGAQVGLQGLSNANQTYGTAISGVNAATGAGQYGLQGLGAAGQAASTLGALGQTQYQQQQGINQGILAAGNQQQANTQQGLSTDYQNYLNNLNYPYQQLSFMQGMYSGLPMSQSASSVYQNTGAQIPQMLGAATTAYGISQKTAKNGGLMQAFAAGGSVAPQAAPPPVPDPQVPQEMSPMALQPLLERLTPAQLQSYAANVKDVVTLGAIRATLQRKMAMQQPPATPPTSTVAQDMMHGGIMGAQPQPQAQPMQQPQQAPQQPAMAGGGIIGMAVGGTPPEPLAPIKNPYGVMTPEEFEARLNQNSAVSPEDTAAAAKMQQLRDEQVGESKRLRENSKWDAVIGLGKGMAQARSWGEALSKGTAGAADEFGKGDAAAEAAQQKAREGQIAQQQYETALRKGDKQLAASILEKQQTAAAQWGQANLQLQGTLAHVAAINGATKDNKAIATLGTLLKSDPVLSTIDKQLLNLTKDGFTASDPANQPMIDELLGKQRNRYNDVVGSWAPQLGLKLPTDFGALVRTPGGGAAGSVDTSNPLLGTK